MNNEGKEYFSKTENSRLGKLKTLKKHSKLFQNRTKEQIVKA